LNILKALCVQILQHPGMQTNVSTAVGMLTSQIHCFT